MTTLVEFSLNIRASLEPRSCYPIKSYRFLINNITQIKSVNNLKK